MERPEDLAARLSLTAEHYARAFREAARIAKIHAGDTPILEKLLITKAEMEEAFKKRLDEDPIGTLEAEGLIYPTNRSRRKEVR